MNREILEADSQTEGTPCESDRDRGTLNQKPFLSICDTLMQALQANQLSR
jgi:hypothetical protein